MAAFRIFYSNRRCWRAMWGFQHHDPISHTPSFLEVLRPLSICLKRRTFGLVSKCFLGDSPFFSISPLKDQFRLPICLIDQYDLRLSPMGSMSTTLTLLVMGGSPATQVSQELLTSVGYCNIHPPLITTEGYPPVHPHASTLNGRKGVCGRFSRLLILLEFWANLPGHTPLAASFSLTKTVTVLSYEPPKKNWFQ